MFARFKVPPDYGGTLILNCYISPSHAETAKRGLYQWSVIACEPAPVAVFKMMVLASLLWGMKWQICLN